MDGALAGQARLGTRVYFEDINGRAFISMPRALVGRPIVDLGFLLDEVAVRRKALDVARVLSSPSPLAVMATDVATGAARVLRDFADAEALFQALRAGATMPVVAGPPRAVGARRYLDALPYSTGKIGIFGTCSGGRQATLVASRTTGFDAAIDCWGGRVVMAKEELTPKQPVAPIDYTADLSCPILGLFGNDDQAPTPAQVDQHEAELKKHGKTYEFYRYNGAGHGFFYYDRPAYRQEQAVDGWKKIWAFLEKHLGAPK